MTGVCVPSAEREGFSPGPPSSPAGGTEPPRMACRGRLHPVNDRRPTLNLSEERAGRQKEVIVTMSTVIPQHADPTTWASALAASLEFVLGEGPFDVDPRAAEKVARETLDGYHSYVALDRRQVA